MMHMQNKGKVLRVLLLLSLLVGGGLVMGARAPSRAYAASPAPPADWVIIPVGFDSPQFGSKQYAYAAITTSNYRLEELYTAADGWHYADLTALTGAPPLNYQTRIAGYDSPQFGSKQYAYVDNSDHVQELYYSRVNGHWRWNDLTTLTGAPLVLNGLEDTLIGFDAPEFGAKVYAYVAQNNHIIELYYSGNGGWGFTDLTRLTNAPSPVGNRIMVGFDSPQYGSRQYAYLDGTGHLEEIYCRGAIVCAVADLTAFTGAPPAAPHTWQVISGFDSPQFDSKQYAYIDASYHLQELYYSRVNGFWRSNDLTALYQAPQPAAFNMTGFDSPQFGSKQYAYCDRNGHLDEVSYWSGTWHTADLTALTNIAIWRAEFVVGFASPQFGTRQYGYIDTMTNDFEETIYVSDSDTWYTVDLAQIARP